MSTTRPWLSPVRVASWCLAILLLLLAGSSLLGSWDQFGRGPSNDYYGVLGLLHDGPSWTDSPARWLTVRSNEHHVLIPALIYRANIELFHGDNRGMVAWSLLMMGCTGLVLLALIPQGLADRPFAFAVAAAPIAVFATVPSAVHNVAMGFSGVMWLTANALGLGAVASLHRGRDRRWGIVVAVCLAVLASFTYSTGLMAWGGLLLLVGLQRQGWRRFVAVAIPAGVVYALSMSTYNRPRSHPELSGDLNTVFHYVTGYLGGIFDGRLEVAQAWGTVALGLIVLVFGLLPLALRSSVFQSLAAPWVVVAAYGLANAIGTGVARSGMGDSQALASRYGTLCAFVWVALFMLPLLLTMEADWVVRSRWRVGLAGVSWLAVLLLWQAPMREYGVNQIESFVVRGSYQDAGFMALQYGIRDDWILGRAFTPAVPQLWRTRDFLKARGHVPFDGEEPKWPKGTIQRGRRPNRGLVETVEALPGGYVRLRGWVAPEEGAVVEMVIADRKGTIEGPAVLGIHRPDVATLHGDEALRSGFVGYLLPTETSMRPRVWTRLSGEDRFFEVPTQHGFKESWRQARAAALTPD